MSGFQPLPLSDLILALYCSLDDALLSVGIQSINGKLIPRRGGKPDVDDREVLCWAVLQELLGYESDHAFYLWFNSNPVIHEFFPRRLTRQNFADRRALLTPLIQQLCGVLCAANGEGDPPFRSSIPILSMSAALSGGERAGRNGLAVSRRKATAQRYNVNFLACGNI